MVSLGSLAGGLGTSLQAGFAARERERLQGESIARNRKRDRKIEERAARQEALQLIQIGRANNNRLLSLIPSFVGRPDAESFLPKLRLQAVDRAADNDRLAQIHKIPISPGNIGLDFDAAVAAARTPGEQTEELATRAGAIAGAEAEATRGIPTRPSGTPPLDPQIVRLQDERAQLETSGDVESLRRAKEITDQIGAIGRGRVLPPAKPVTGAAQEDISFGIQALKNLDVMEEFISQTGIIKGMFSELGAFIGTNEDAIQFQVNSDQFFLGLQSFIKGIPSDFDSKKILRPLKPSLRVAQPRNVARINAARQMARSLISDRIAFFKSTGNPIPPEIIAAAQAQGINVGEINPTEPGADPFQNSIDLANSIPLEIQDFSVMALDQLGQVPLKKLSPDEIAIWNRRAIELGLE